MSKRQLLTINFLITTLPHTPSGLAANCQCQQQKRNSNIYNHRTVQRTEQSAVGGAGPSAGLGFVVSVAVENLCFRSAFYMLCSRPLPSCMLPQCNKMAIKNAKNTAIRNEIAFLGAACGWQCEKGGGQRHKIIFSHRPPWLALFKICAKNAEGPSYKSKIATLAIYTYLHCVYDTFDDQINCNAAMHKTRHSRLTHTFFLAMKYCNYLQERYAKRRLMMISNWWYAFSERDIEREREKEAERANQQKATKCVRDF